MNRGAHYFSEKLLPNRIVRITSKLGNYFPVSNPGEIFYSIKDGNWNDASVWETVSGRVGKLPTASDDVYVKHNISYNTTTATINNLFVSAYGSLTYTGGFTLNINGDFKCDNTFTMHGISACIVSLSGYNNYCKNFTAGTGTVTYNRNGDQVLMDVQHNNVQINTGGTKYMLSGNNYFAGSFFVNTNAICFKTDAGNVIFGGLLSAGVNSSVGFYGNNKVECRGGVNFNNTNFFSGSGNWDYTTNSQTVTFNGFNYQFNGAVRVVGNIAVTNASTNSLATSTSPASCCQINVSLDGTTAGSTWINRGNVMFNITGDAMNTGMFDKDTYNTNCVGYIANASHNLQFTSYQGLFIAGNGVKSAIGNMTLGTFLNTANYAGASYGILEMSTYNISIGTTSWLMGSLSKSGAGTVLFTGSVTTGNSQTTPNIPFINFTGNPSVEMRNGLSTTHSSSVASIPTFVAGTGIWTFTTNSQTINAAGASLLDFNDIIVSGNITLNIVTSDIATNTPNNTSIFWVRFLNSLNGTIAGSTLVNKGVLATTQSSFMTTGTVDLTSNTNVVLFMGNNSFNLPHTAYSSLYVAGTGTKTLSGNTTIARNLFVHNGTTLTTELPVLECSSYNLNVGLVTVLGLGGATYNRGQLRKAGAGSVLFTGELQLGNSNPTSIDFTGGNPSVECRNGIQCVNTPAAGLKTGSSTWTFSTNNQSFSGNGNNNMVFDAPILISGAVTLTVATANTNPIFKGAINGNNAASTFDNRGVIDYQSATQPMLTGILQTNAAVNTFRYSASGNQDVKGGTYRIINFGGSGVKTLQGNVVVNVTGGGSQSTTGTASVNNNGFTITTI